MNEKQARFVFAAFALMGLIAGPGKRYDRSSSDDEALAEDAWQIAEAMIAEAPVGMIDP